MASKNKPMVLVADDDPTIRFLIREVLEEAGFAVEEADDGETAVAAFCRLRPDIVMLDVKMPGQDGFEACARIRRMPEGESTPVLMMTGFDDIDSVRKAYEAGATQFITKPIHLVNLEHHIHYILRATLTCEKLRESEARLAEAQRIAGIGSWEIDIQTRKMHWSEEVYRIFAIERTGSAVSHDIFEECIHPLDRPNVTEVMKRLSTGESGFSIDCRIINRKNMERFIHAETQLKLNPAGQPVQAVGYIQDVTSRRQAEEKIRQLAYFDSLTGLPNRAHFTERFGSAMQRAKRMNYLLSALFIDLDRFKQINDTFGHSVGDELLKQVANRLSTCVRTCDRVYRDTADESDAQVSRFAGDEFLVMLENIREYYDAAKVANRMLEAFSTSFVIQDFELSITPSIGISIYPLDGESQEEIIQHADIAMYHAKKLGRNNFQFYSDDLNIAAVEHLRLEGRLRRSLEQDELFLCFQPMIDMSTSKVFCVEVLVRWQNPECGLLLPGDFIPLAEETGLVAEVDEWVLQNACRYFVDWCERGFPAFRISVNISRQHFRDKSLISLVDRVLTDTGMDPKYLGLEITEGILLGNDPDTINTMHSLKSKGIKLSLDDFGTGYSSLSCLKKFPLDVLKIDRSFIKNILTDVDSQSIASAIIALSGVLQLETIAEGVEKPEQMEMLLEKGCGKMQGYLFSQPLTVPEFEKYCSGNEPSQN